MRTPINPVPEGMQGRITSAAIAFTMDAFELQPGSPGAGGTTPLGRLGTVQATLVDDASQTTQRRMTINVSAIPDYLQPGMWIRSQVGIQVLQPVIYRLPSLIITDIARDLAQQGGGVVTAEDPGSALNGRPYEVDTAVTGTLRSLVANACATTLTRPADVTGVPDIPLPVATVVEFGTGRWDACITLGDALGVALRFTDAGDVIGVLRSAEPPAPVGIVERSVTDSGTRSRARTPTAAKVMVTRGSDTPGLIGSALASEITGGVVPGWYLPFVVVDRQEGDANTTQAQADTLARNLIRSRLADLDTWENMPILPAPWLEAGSDVVTLFGNPYVVRAVTVDYPGLTTHVTLRRIL